MSLNPITSIKVDTIVRKYPETHHRNSLVRPVHRMSNSQRLTTVRSAIEGYLAGQANQPGGDNHADCETVDCKIAVESILIRDEHYCGRRFSTSTHRAVWFIEEDQVKIYTADQQHLCCVMNTNEIDAAADLPEDESPQVISIDAQRIESEHGNKVDSDIADNDEGFRRAA